jgi:hypothetical protein
MTSILILAYFLAGEVAWRGSASDARCATLLAPRGVAAADAAAVVAAAVAAGLLVPIPRIGGYTAGRAVTAAELGEAYAEALAA